MKFSVIIPTFNRATVLARAIISVLEQTYRDFDLWIVDDGSTDETRKLCLEFQEKDERIHYVYTDNRGVSYARNLGLICSPHVWKAFLDSDDEWLPHKLEKQAALLKKHPELKVIHGEEIWIRNGVRVNQMKKHHKCGGYIFENCLPLCVISPSAVVIHQDVFERVGNFDEDYTVCEDYELWLRMTLLFEVGFISDPVLKKYGGHEDQLSRKYFAMDYYRIKALDNIFKKAEAKNYAELLSHIILKKGRILLKGYEKHNNFANYEEVDAIVQKHAANFTT